MRKFGVSNPIILAYAHYSFYIFWSMVTHMAASDKLTGGLDVFIFLIFMFVLFVIFPAIALYFYRIVIFREKVVTVIYPFRFRVRNFPIVQLRTVHTQRMVGYGEAPSLNQTYLYFGGGQRVNISAYEFLNYWLLRQTAESLVEQPREL